MTKNIQIPDHYPENSRSAPPERRTGTGDRRRPQERRAQEERRFDSRLAAATPRKTIRTWLRSMTHSRLGVDRRKKDDRRLGSDRRRQSFSSILTREEIADLLAPLPDRRNAFESPAERG